MRNDLKGTISSIKDDDGYYFIDRNGKVFEVSVGVINSGLQDYISPVLVCVRLLTRAFVLGVATFSSLPSCHSRT